ncbi:1516_t:CDS:1, partial [Racocetra persica]
LNITEHEETESDDKKAEHGDEEMTENSLSESESSNKNTTDDESEEVLE